MRTIPLGGLWRTALAASAIAAITTVGCDDKPATAPQAEAAADKPAAAAEKPKLIDVQYGLEVTPPAAEGQDGTATWSIIVPTGGWKMTTDSVLVEDWRNAPAVRVYVTLEQPGAGEMVTQALETLTDKKSGKDVTKAEFSVRQKIRGVESPWAPMYKVVKTVPANEF